MGTEGISLFLRSSKPQTINMLASSQLCELYVIPLASLAKLLRQNVRLSYCFSWVIAKTLFTYIYSFITPERVNIHHNTHLILETLFPFSLQILIH